MPLSDDIIKAHLQIMVAHYPQYITIQGASNVACIATGHNEQIVMDMTGEVDTADIVFIIPTEGLAAEPISGDIIEYRGDEYRVMSTRSDPANAGYRVSAKKKQ